MGRTLKATRTMLGRGNGTEQARFSRDGGFFPNANAQPSIEDLSPQHYVGADSRSAISRIADQNYDVLIELDLAAFAPNGVPALQVPQGFAGDGWQENRQFFRNDSAAFQGPYVWPNAVQADTVIGNGVHLPGWVPAPPAASESDERLDIVTRASRLSQHFYSPESDQTMGFGMPLEDGDNGVLNSNIINLVELESHAAQPPSQYQEMDSVGPFYCVLCDTTIKRKSDYERHMKTTVRHGGGRHVCPKCERPYTRQTTFRDHKCKPRQSKRL